MTVDPSRRAAEALPSGTLAYDALATGEGKRAALAIRAQRIADWSQIPLLTR
jgi:hypothetical protein